MYVKLCIQKLLRYKDFDSDNSKTIKIQKIKRGIKTKITI